jgi:hypothetical protein
MIEEGLVQTFNLNVPPIPNAQQQRINTGSIRSAARADAMMNVAGVLREVDSNSRMRRRVTERHGVGNNST